MSQTVQSKTEEAKEEDIRASWKVNSYCLIYSRSDNKWYDAKIEKIFVNKNENDDEKLSNEWLMVRYKNHKKTKTIQRNCADIKPIDDDHKLSLKKGSICLIYSNIIKLWCEGQVISIFTDKDGEWLKIKYWDTNEHKICDIQRYSKELQIFKRYLLWTGMVNTVSLKKPWIALGTNNLILPPKLSNIIPLNDNEFIAAAYSDEANDANNSEYAFSNAEKNGIYKYNILKNRWHLWLIYPNHFFSQYHNICMDYKQGIIYLFNGIGCGGMWKIHIKTQRFECIALGNIECFGILSYVIDGTFNIFFGNNNGNHLVYDNGELDIIYEFAEFKKGLISFGMVYNKVDEYFLFFGGFKGKDLGRTDGIWKYSPNGCKWEKLALCVPDKMQSFGSVISENCEYVMLIGGSNSDGLSDQIHILNLLTMKWRLSNVISPFQGVGFGNVTIVKNQYDNKEYVHLVQAMYSHIKVSLDDILAN